MSDKKFYMILGVLFMINSNVEDNHMMKVISGTVGIMMFVFSINFLKEKAND